MFFVGQKVVCVDDSRSSNCGKECPFVRGEIYTVEAVFHLGQCVCPFCNRTVDIIDPTAIALIGMDKCSRRTCRMWSASRFRPVTDIGWAHKLVQEVKNMSPKDMVRV